MRRSLPVLLLFAMTAVLPRPGAAAVTNPIVEGPIGGGVRGHAWNASLVDVAAYGFVEEEFFYSGVATTRASGASAPFKSRMLVKRPVDASKFNGTVVVEWLNVTGATDLETVWPVTYEYFLRHGIAYVGVSAQLVGVCCGPNSLKGWDPARYATLVHPGDDFSFDIFSQAMKAIRDPLHNRTSIASPRVVDPLGGLGMKWIVASGASQSATRLTSYINNGYDAAAGLVDVFTITRGGGPFNSYATPIFQLNEEGQGVRDADNDHYRVWEEAGTAHAPAAWWNYIWEMQMRDNNAPTAPNAVNMGCSVNRGSVDYSARALTAATQVYLENGKDAAYLPPSVPRIVRSSGSTVARDADGLAVGGMRHPFVQVPVSLNQASGCPLYGLYKSWPREKILARYPAKSDYVSAVNAWADYELGIDWLTPEDAIDVKAKAATFDVWTDGSCYDTYNASSSEAGPASSGLHAASYDPSLPLGAQSAARDVTCNAAVPLGL